jgi:hypothetical protein
MGSRGFNTCHAAKGRFHEDNVFHVGGTPTIWLYWTESLSSEPAGQRCA